jgi:putative FmdB family regulatory protein
MPIYDFHCPRCDKSFELFVKPGGSGACPTCGSEELEKLVSLTAPPGKTAGVIASARAQASREGHFSNYAPSERPRRKG